MLKMWLSAVVVCVFLGLCVAQGYSPEYPPGQYRPSYPQEYSNYPPYYAGGYRQPVGDDAIVTLLDNLLKDVARFEERELAQREKILFLRQNSDQTRAFQYKFEDVASKDINDEILEQNVRLYNLAEKIATIKGLRTQVDKLQNTAEEIRNVTEATIAADIADRLNDAREYGIANDIQEAYTQALTVSKGQQAVADQQYDISRVLTTLELAIDQIIARLNYKTAKATEVDLDADEQGIAVAEVPHPGFPNNYHGFLTGFEHRFGKYGAPDQANDISIEVLFSNPGSNVTQVFLNDNSPSHQDTVVVLAFSTTNVKN